MSTIHESFEEGFKPEERYTFYCIQYFTCTACISLKSDHNATVRVNLIQEVSLAHSDKYKEGDTASKDWCTMYNN